jgi:ketosteroid isomerase-like protein
MIRCDRSDVLTGERHDRDLPGETHGQQQPDNGQRAHDRRNVRGLRPRRRPARPGPDGPDVEWIETEAESIPAHGTFASPQEVLESVLAKVPEYFEQFELHPELWVEAGDDVVVTGRVVARTRTGRKLDAPDAHVFSFRDGKVCRNDNFHDTALWVAALS